MGEDPRNYIGSSMASQQALWESELITLIEGTSRAGEDPHTKLAHHTPHGAGKGPKSS